MTRFYEEPWRYSFYQAVRLIQNAFAFSRLAETSKKNLPKRAREPVGYDVSPDRELIRFSAATNMAFSGADVVSVTKKSDKKRASADDCDNMEIGFMGVAGVNGALPTYYTEFMLQRQRVKDSAMSDFYDLFNHRSISFFYRAWQKYRLSFSYESHQVHGNQDSVDPITNSLLALIGRRVTTVDTKKSIDSATKLLLYAGVYASSQRSPVTLAALLSDYFNIPASIEQFVGEWSEFNDDDRATLGPCTGKEGQNNSLGRNTLIGTRVYCVESRFRIVLGPLNKTQFERIKPGSEEIRTLCDFVKGYVGPNVKFDLKIILSSSAVSCARLAGNNVTPSHLGWNTWLCGSDQRSWKGKLTDILVPSQS